VVLISPLHLQIVFESDIRRRNGEPTRGIRTAPYSYQEGPSFALTSTYTLATDFADIPLIAEELTMPMISTKGDAKP